VLAPRARSTAWAASPAGAGGPPAQVAAAAAWPGSGRVRDSEPSMKARASSDRRRLRFLAKSRRRRNAWSMSRQRRSASLPLACSMMTRLFSAVCSCSLRVSLSRMQRFQQAKSATQVALVILPRSA